MNEGPASRVRRVTLHNFRGWGEEEDGKAKAVSCDGDVVLLVGSNGLGKTSLLEALTLILSGHRVHRSARGDEDQGTSALVHGEADAFEICAELGAGGESTAEVKRECVTTADAGQRPMTDYWSRVHDHTARDGEVPTELLAAATSFFQDDVRSVLDDLARSSTLREWFRPVHPVVEASREWLKGAADDLEANVRKHRAEMEDDARPNSAFAERAGDFVKQWNAWRDDPATPHALPPVPETLAEPEGLHAFVLALRETWPTPKEGAGEDPAAGDVPGREPRLDDRPGVLLATIGSFIDAVVGEARDSERIAELREALKRARDARDDLERRFPPEDVKHVLAWERPAGQGLPGLEQMLESLRVGRDGWQRGIPDLPGHRQVLEALERELARLDPGTLGALVAGVRDYLRPYHDAGRRLEELKTKIARLEQEVSRREMALGLPPGLRPALRRWADPTVVRAEQGRRERHAGRAERKAVAARWASLAAALTEVEAELSHRLEAPADGDAWGKTMKVLCECLDQTLFRFELGPGALPVRPRPVAISERGSRAARDGLRLEAADRRSWADLSTGQKAQLALAYMLAQALVLSPQLPHRVLLLDDTSTAFDLGNLARQATWLRQLAYTTEPDKRWQVFLASHHDEMTSRLVELLLPPPGRKLVVLSFEGWEPGRGPEVSVYERVGREPEGTALPGAHERLGEALKMVWHRPRRWRGDA